MVRPGATTRKPRVNLLLPGRRTALIVCQAMIIAMTVVLPAPVASFSARRISSGLASLLALARCSRKPLAGLAQLRRDLGQPDGGFDRFDLAEERADVAELVMPPVLEQARGFGRDLPVVRIRPAAPLVDVVAELVDDRESGRTAAPRWRALCLRRRRAAAGPPVPLRFLGLGIGVMNSARSRPCVLLSISPKRTSRSASTRRRDAEACRSMQWHNRGRRSRSSVSETVHWQMFSLWTCHRLPARMKPIDNSIT